MAFMSPRTRTKTSTCLIGLTCIRLNFILNFTQHACQRCDNNGAAFLPTAVARLIHRNSVRPSVCPFVTRMDQSKTAQAKITKFLPSAAWKALVSGSVKLFHRLERGRSPRTRALNDKGVWEMCDFLANTAARDQ